MQATIPKLTLLSCHDSLQEGERLIKEFLGQIKSLPLDTLSDDQVMAEVDKLKQNVESKGNPYIRELLAK